MAVNRLLVVCLSLALVGCVSAREKRVKVPLPEHVGRASAAAEPRVAVFGEGHNLDDVLKDVGIESHTDAVVSGPLVGREVLDVARSHGHSLVGDKLVPARKRPVPVPSELQASVQQTVPVGGFAVKMVDEAELDQWRDLSSVVHEAYSTEFLIVSVTASRSIQLSAIFQGQGAVSVTYPTSVGGALSGSSVTGGVSLAANGSIVQGRVVGHPVLTGSPAATATVHVGQKIPVMLSQSTVTNQTTTSLGQSLTYISTGTNVTARQTRVSATQIRLTGSVTLSDQVSTINNVPVTDDRSVSLDHIVTLGEWTLLGQLDSTSAKFSRGWLGLGGLWATSDDTFVVLAKPRQVHRDSRNHVGAVTDVKEPEYHEMKEPEHKAIGPKWAADVHPLKPGGTDPVVDPSAASVGATPAAGVGGAPPAAAVMPGTGPPAVQSPVANPGSPGVGLPSLPNR